METMNIQDAETVFQAALLGIFIIFMLIMLVCLVKTLFWSETKHSKCYIIKDCPHWLEYANCCMYSRCVRIKRTGDDKGSDQEKLR